MEPASRTPDGESNTCFVCGASVVVAPSHPPGDAPCPNCGTLLWFNELTPAAVEQLEKRGAHIDTDDSGKVVSIRFTGDIYDDSALPQLERISGLRTLDIRETKISANAAARLRELMPNTLILHG